MANSTKVPANLLRVAQQHTGEDPLENHSSVLFGFLQRGYRRFGAISYASRVWNESLLITDPALANRRSSLVGLSHELVPLQRQLVPARQDFPREIGGKVSLDILADGRNKYLPSYFSIQRRKRANAAKSCNQDQLDPSYLISKYVYSYERC